MGIEDANSLYGCLAFREYNTYSPRCGMSVTMCGDGLFM